jgi:hypothetical protein
MKKHQKTKLFGFTFYLHLALIILAYASPFLFNWKWIFIGIFTLFVEYWIFEGCILTNKQFGKDQSMTFYTIYLEMLGFKFDRMKFKFFIRYIMPFIVLTIAIIWQILLRKIPILF